MADGSSLVAREVEAMMVEIQERLKNEAFVSLRACCVDCNLLWNPGEPRPADDSSKAGDDLVQRAMRSPLREDQKRDENGAESYLAGDECHQHPSLAEMSGTRRITPERPATRQLSGQSAGEAVIGNSDTRGRNRRIASRRTPGSSPKLWSASVSPRGQISPRYRRSKLRSSFVSFHLCRWVGHRS
jgi:hypothetical protein